MSGNRLIRPAVTPRAPGSLILVALAAAAGCGGHTISGEVTGGGVVEVVLSGRASARTTTDASGRYAFASLADGDYAVTPRKTSWSFVPPSVAVTVKSANAVAKTLRAREGACTAQGWCWQNPLPQGNHLNAVWGAGPADAWIVGDNGTILHWNGKVWSAVASGTSKSLSSVWGSGAQDVWAVGGAGTTLHFDGATWSSVQSRECPPTSGGA